MHRTDLKYAIIIPARYKSSRYPGKPLIDLAGKSMIRRVWEQSVKAVGIERVFIATDDAKIQDHCMGFTSNVIMTSEDCMTGTDRVAEVAELLDLDYAINVQGDEPIIDPKDILLVKEAYENSKFSLVNAMAPIENEQEHRSLTIPKVVVDLFDKLLYMSRAAIPGSKQGQFNWGWKQVCIYAFSRTALQSFTERTQKTPLEQEEDIEILRFLELGFDVAMVKVDSGSVAIDTPEDRERVMGIINARSI